MKNSWFSNLEIEKIIRDLNQVEEDGERLNREEQKQTRVQVDDQESVRGEQVEKRDAWRQTGGRQDRIGKIVYRWVGGGRSTAAAKPEKYIRKIKESSGERGYTLLPNWERQRDEQSLKSSCKCKIKVGRM